MKKIFTGFCFSIYLLVVYGQSSIDVLHYRFEIELSDKNDTIYGKAEITLEKFRNEKNIKFNLAGLNPAGKGMILDSVKWGRKKLPVADKNEVFTDIENCRFENNELRLLLGSGKTIYKTESLKDTTSFIIYYHGIPSDGLIISRNKFGNRTLFADNWPNRAHHWIPCVDDPSEKASVEFIVTAPPHYRVISNGLLIEEKIVSSGKKTTHWKEEVPLPTKVMVIGVAEFAVDTAGSVNGIPVYSYVYPQNKEAGFYDYAQATEILDWFIQYVGPYPYKKLANVQSTTRFGGMENANAIFYHENSVTGKRIDESLLAHEIAHQWFGNMVTEKSFAHLWLSEGFATYLTHIYMESKYGRELFLSRMKEDRETIIAFAAKNRKAVVDSISPPMSLLNANSYQKGSWVLHMLRCETGDSVFQQILRSYYDTYKGKNAATGDFRKIAEEISGKNLEPFFRQWLYQPGLPDLSIVWSYQERAKELRLTVTQQQEPVFVFPLEMTIKSVSGQTETISVNVDSRQISRTFPVKEKPLEITADPHTRLLFRGRIRSLK
jgi:aminopeptidase N